MPRSNLCVNPAMDVSVSGWGGGATPTRQAVSGFAKGFAARYTSGTFLTSARATVAPSSPYTMSVYARLASFNKTINVYLEWLTAGGGFISDTTGSQAFTAGVVGRASLSATSPSNAGLALLVFDGENFASNNLDVTCLLIEPGSTLNAYADGDTAGWAWDGTTGLSSSSEQAAAPPSRPPSRTSQYSSYF